MSIRTPSGDYRYPNRGYVPWLDFFPWPGDAVYSTSLPQQWPWPCVPTDAPATISGVRSTSGGLVFSVSCSALDLLVERATLDDAFEAFESDLLSQRDSLLALIPQAYDSTVARHLERRLCVVNDVILAVAKERK